MAILILITFQIVHVLLLGYVVFKILLFIDDWILHMRSWFNYNINKAMIDEAIA